MKQYEKHLKELSKQRLANKCMDELEFDREALLSFNGMRIDDKEDYIKLLCSFIDYYEDTKISLQILNNDLRDKYMLNAYYIDKHIYVEEVKEAYLNLRKRLISSSIPFEDVLNGKSSEWILIPDYTVCALSWRDIIQD